MSPVCVVVIVTYFNVDVVRKILSPQHSVYRHCVTGYREASECLNRIPKTVFDVKGKFLKPDSGPAEEAVVRIPLKSLVLESDALFLYPNGSQLCITPVTIFDVADGFAQLRKVQRSVALSIKSENANRLYSLRFIDNKGPLRRANGPLRFPFLYISARQIWRRENGPLNCLAWSAGSNLCPDSMVYDGEDTNRIYLTSESFMSLSERLSWGASAFCFPGLLMTFEQFHVFVGSLRRWNKDGSPLVR